MGTRSSCSLTGGGGATMRATVESFGPVLPLDGAYTYGATGEGVTAYVIDTGTAARIRSSAAEP